MPNPQPDEVVEAAIRLRNEGKTYQQIADALGFRARTAVRNLLLSRSGGRIQEAGAPHRATSPVLWHPDHGCELRPRCLSCDLPVCREDQPRTRKKKETANDTAHV